MDLTLRSWMHAQENQRQVIQRSDVTSAMCQNETFDFLIDIVPEMEAELVHRSAMPPTILPSENTNSSPTGSPTKPPSNTFSSIVTPDPYMYMYPWTPVDKMALIRAGLSINDHSDTDDSHTIDRNPQNHMSISSSFHTIPKQFLMNNNDSVHVPANSSSLNKPC
jgi:hypothetical protein